MLFNELYKVQQRSVAKKVNNAMQKNMPPGTPKKIKSQVSSQGFKQEATIDTYNHDGVSIPDAVAHIGNSLGNTGDLYRDCNNPLHGIRAARVQSGYHNLNGNDFLPRLDTLGLVNLKCINRFFYHLYVILVKDFKRGEDLYPVLKICTASLILFHPEVTK